MMAKRGKTCVLGVLGIMAIACILAGFIAPGWIIMKRSLEEFDVPMDLFRPPWERQMIDDGGLPGEMPIDDGGLPGEMPIDDGGLGDGPMEENGVGPMIPMADQSLIRDRRQAMDGMGEGEHMMDSEQMMNGGEMQQGDYIMEREHMMTGEGMTNKDYEGSFGHHGPDQHRERGQPMDMGPGSWGGRQSDWDHRPMEDWARNGFGFAQALTSIQMKSLHLHVYYGLWFSVYCVKVHDETSWETTGSHQFDRKDKCSCLKMSTEHALKYAYLFDSIGWVGMPTYDQVHYQLRKGHMGGASLKEHRIEATIGVVLCLIGVISGIVGFVKVKRCCLFVCILAMLISLPLLMLPSVRLAKFSRQHGSMYEGVHQRPPYSAIATLVGCLPAFIIALVALFKLARKHQKEAPGKWNKFNNELVASDVSGDVKKPSLVFLNDPLPDKPGLYDVCDFSDVKLAEECEGGNSIA